MSRLGDILYFLRQIFFPKWVDREENAEPTWVQKYLTRMLLFLASRNGMGAAFSIVLHLFVLAILALITIPQWSSFTAIDILGDFKIPGVDQPAIIAPKQNDEVSSESHNIVPEYSMPEPAPAENPAESPPLPVAEPVVESLDNLTSEQRVKLQAAGGFVDGGGFQHRTPAGRQGAMQGGGCSAGGEEAIESALRWFVAHQQRDGGWSLYFEDSCKRCSPSGTGTSNRRTAATALALLSFLGAGYSHQVQSPYRDNVDRGLRFLIEDQNGGVYGGAIIRDSLQMYSYGLASMALCEAYAMCREQDPALKLGRAAQRSLLLIETAQDPEYGGWNYRSDQMYRGENEQSARVGGDTSIFAWQLMALKSGKIGGLHVSQSVLYAAQDFLDAVALEGGRYYQYTPPSDWKGELGIDSPKTCTAIGLLMRMYLGWKPGDPFLDDGMEQLARWGHTPRVGETNLYYAYYATLALHHYGGEHWDSWNSDLQDFLIRTQSRQQSCESGSWYFPDSYCDSGGRLLSTALAVMILETPYRFMPLYREIRQN